MIAVLAEILGLPRGTIMVHVKLSNYLRHPRRVSANLLEPDLVGRG